MIAGYVAPVLPCAPEPELYERAHKVVDRAREIEFALSAGGGQVPDGGYARVRWDGYYPARRLLDRLLGRSGFLGVGSWDVRLGNDRTLSVKRTSSYRGSTVERLERRTLGQGSHYFYERDGSLPIEFTQMPDGRIFFH